MRDRIARAIDNYIDERASGTRPADDDIHKRVKHYAERDDHREQHLGTIDVTEDKQLVCPIEIARIEETEPGETRWMLVDDGDLVDTLEVR